MTLSCSDDCGAASEPGLHAASAVAASAPPASCTARQHTPPAHVQSLGHGTSPRDTSATATAHHATTNAAWSQRRAHDTRGARQRTSAVRGMRTADLDGAPGPPPRLCGCVWRAACHRRSRHWQVVDTACMMWSHAHLPLCRSRRIQRMLNDGRAKRWPINHTVPQFIAGSARHVNDLGGFTQYPSAIGCSHVQRRPRHR